MPLRLPLLTFPLVALAVFAQCAAAQDSGPRLTSRDSQTLQAEKTEAVPADSSQTFTIPSGTTIPVKLMHAISTKSAKPGDKVYAETTFPLVINEHVLIPAGTYVQGVIVNAKRPGRIKGRGELLVHFTTLVYPSGYTVMLPGSVDQIPGAETQQVKDSEGTIQQQGEKGKDAKTVAQTAGEGALIGAVADRGAKGLALGAASGGVAGLAIALLSRGSDLRLESGSTLEMIFQRDVTVNSKRLAQK
jgi:type IV secretion system protein VirB10